MSIKTKHSLLLATMVLAFSLPNAANEIAASKTTPENFAIAIHGGAGTISKAKMTLEKRAKYQAKLAQAVNEGHALLAQGKSSTDAVIAAIQILEESPLFNAGKGAVYTFEGSHELDASIMDGQTKQAGAIAGVKNVKSPIALAEQVMKNSVHVMLSGKGAEDFAQKQGLELVENSYFDTDFRYQSLLKAKKKLAEKEIELKDFQAAH